MYHVVFNLEVELQHLTGAVVDNHIALSDKLRVAEFVADENRGCAVAVAHHPIPVVLAVVIVDWREYAVLKEILIIDMRGEVFYH